MTKIEEIKALSVKDNIDTFWTLTEKLNEIIKHLNEKEEGIPDDGEPPCKNCGMKLPKDDKSLSHFFKPEIGEKYWYIHPEYSEIASEDYKDFGMDRFLVFCGNCYRTREEAQCALDKQQALVRLWDWADKNAPFTQQVKDKLLSISSILLSERLNLKI